MLDEWLDKKVYILRDKVKNTPQKTKNKVYAAIALVCLFTFIILPLSFGLLTMFKETYFVYLEVALIFVGGLSLFALLMYTVGFLISVLED